MPRTSLCLFGHRRFLPLFATQFLGAFNDNLYRSAMLFLLSFTVYRDAPDRAALMAIVSGGVFILPFFLFSSIAGELADRIDKARVAIGVKLGEVLIMLLGFTAFETESLELLMAALFAMGIHSTIFGPIKYSILPQHLAPDELMGGTSLVEAGTFLAILLGQIAGGLLPAATAPLAMLGVAVLGLVTSLFIPPAPPPEERAELDTNLARSTVRIVAHAMRDHALLLTIIGITWFFALGAVLTQQFVPLVSSLHAAPPVATLFLALFSVGVAIGSLVIGRLLRGEISARYVPASAFALACAVMDLAFTTHGLTPTGRTAGIGDFLAAPGRLHLMLDLLAISIAGGMFIVPLYALLQTLGEPASRSRDVAANNILNAAGMVLITVLATGLLASGSGNAGVFGALAGIGLAIAFILRRLARETAGR